MANVARDDPRASSASRGSHKQGIKLYDRPLRHAELLLITSGAVEVITGAGRWVIPPELGLWIPPRSPYEVTTLSQVTTLALRIGKPMVDAASPPIPCEHVFAFRVTDLLRELVLELSRIPALSSRAELLSRLVLLELNEIPNATTFLPLPRSAITRAAANTALSDPHGLLGIDDFAAGVSRSARTLSRLFFGETGLNFRAWRRRARMVSAARRLSGPVSIPMVATEFGFESGSEFSCEFRKEIGITPDEFLNLWSPSRSKML